MVAWLLRVNRLYGDNERLANLTRFAAQFPGGCWPGPVSASQISRWETAAARAGFTVLRRYEELLGLPSRRLTAVADWAYRKASASTGPPVLDRGLDPADPRMHEHTGDLLDRALSAGLMTGANWDELTSHLAVLPTVLLHPRSAWADLAGRLLAELLISDGLAWLTRIEALARLMAHPRARPPIVAACGALAADPTSQIVIEPLTILDMTARPDAARHVLRPLTCPTSDRALRGALLAAVEKIPRGHFIAPQLRSLATAADLLASTGAAPKARVLAAELARLVPGQRGPTVNGLRCHADPTARAILTHGETGFPGAADTVVTRILARALAQMPRGPREGTDPTLGRLLTELLFSPNQTRRLLAGQLIAATPYHSPIGAALATEISSRPAAHGEPLATALICAMTSVGRPADRSVVERLATAAGLPGTVTDTAAWVIGHVPGCSSQQFWWTALHAHARAWQRTRSPASISALQGLTYALGISRQHSLLRAIRADTRLPRPTRAAANWWLNIPSHIHTSAAHTE